MIWLKISVFKLAAVFSYENKFISLNYVETKAQIIKTMNKTTFKNRRHKKAREAKIMILRRPFKLILYHGLDTFYFSLMSYAIFK